MCARPPAAGLLTHKPPAVAEVTRRDRRALDTEEQHRAGNHRIGGAGAQVRWQRQRPGLHAQRRGGGGARRAPTPLETTNSAQKTKPERREQLRSRAFLY